MTFLYPNVVKFVSELLVIVPWDECKYCFLKGKNNKKATTNSTVFWSFYFYYIWKQTTPSWYHHHSQWILSKSWVGNYRYCLWNFSMMKIQNNAYLYSRKMILIARSWAKWNGTTSAFIAIQSAPLHKSHSKLLTLWTSLLLSVLMIL